MLDDQQKVLLRDSWRMVVPIAETAADLFYKRLFELRPDYRGTEYLAALAAAVDAAGLRPG